MANPEIVSYNVAEGNLGFDEGEETQTYLTLQVAITLRRRRS